MVTHSALDVIPKLMFFSFIGFHDVVLYMSLMDDAELWMDDKE